MFIAYSNMVGDNNFATWIPELAFFVCSTGKEKRKGKKVEIII